MVYIYGTRSGSNDGLVLLIMWDIVHDYHIQWPFCEFAQPIRDDVTLWRSLSLARRINKMIPAHNMHHCTWWVFSRYSALPMPRGHFSLNKSRKTPKARPSEWARCVFLEFQVWPRLYIRRCSVVCNIVLHCTVIYWMWIESRLPW